MAHGGRNAIQNGMRIVSRMVGREDPLSRR